jgi:hypothetical protein
MLPPTPPFLQGVWHRRSIRRALYAGGELGHADSSVNVTYIQTPICFVDVRVAAGDGDGCMAFAGVTTAVAPSDEGPVTVRWHACLNLDPFVPDAAAAWQAADHGTPRLSGDVGEFSQDALNADGTVWIERDPAPTTLEEVWERVDDGDGRFLALRRGTAILVVAGRYFGFASDERSIHSPDGEHEYATGRVSLATGWTVEARLGSSGSSGKDSLQLTLPGYAAEWVRMPGSTLDWPSPEDQLPPLTFSLH